MRTIWLFILGMIGCIILMGCMHMTKDNQNNFDYPYYQKIFEEMPEDTRIKFTISSNKKTYTFEESIYIQISFKNLAESPITVNKRFAVGLPEGEVGFDVSSPTGKPVGFNALVQIGYPLIKDYITLQPGEVYISDYKYDIKEDHDFTQSGKYKISAIYRIDRVIFEQGRKHLKKFKGIDIPSDAWTGKLISNTIEVEILPREK